MPPRRRFGAVEAFATLCYIFRMAKQIFHDPIFQRFRTALNEIYGDRVERVVLFGSRARGGAA
jgi:uncharacterized protein